MKYKLSFCKYVLIRVNIRVIFLRSNTYMYLLTYRCSTLKMNYSKVIFKDLITFSFPHLSIINA